MNSRRIQYHGLQYAVLTEDESCVSLIESSGVFHMATRYGHFESKIDTLTLTIPEVIKDEDGKKYTVIAIEKSVFDNNKTIQEVRIPCSVKKIAWGFWECSNLNRIIVSEDNPYYCDRDGVLYNKKGDTLVAFPNAYGHEYSVVSGTVTISKHAFKNTGIQILSLPSTVRRIQTNAFYRCNQLREVHVNSDMPVEIDPMVGDYGNVNPVFYYRGFSALMNDSIHCHHESYKKVGGRFVYDYNSCSYGALRPDGKGFIGEHFDALNKLGELYFYGFSPKEDYSECNDWFATDDWGAISLEGRVITPAKYKCFEVVGSWLLGASSAVLRWDEMDKPYYSHCVYDLYDIISGRLIVRGIQGVKETENPNIVLLRLIDKEYGPILAYNICELKSVLQMPDGRQLSLSLGDDLISKIGHVEEQPLHYRQRIKEQYESVLTYSAPSIYRNYSVFCSQDKKNHVLVRNSDGSIIKEASRIVHVCDDCFYLSSPVARSFQVPGLPYELSLFYYGVVNEGKEIIPFESGFYLLTKSIGGYLFGAKELNEKTSEVFLIDINDSSRVHSISVISSIPTTKLSFLLRDGKLEHAVSVDGKIRLQDIGILDERVSNLGIFISDQSLAQTEDDHPMRFWRYWYSGHPRIMNPELFDD